jgi:hypothetical protein
MSPLPRWERVSTVTRNPRSFPDEEQWILGVLLFAYPGPRCIRSRFASDFAATPDRVWIGPQYWANPMEDWRVQDGRLECISNGGNRNVHVLTHQLADRPGRLEMSVRAGLLERRPSGSAGFRVGIADQIIDYRGNCFWGNGVNAVLGVNGLLILADQRKKLGPRHRSDRPDASAERRTGR